MNRKRRAPDKQNAQQVHSVAERDEAFPIRPIKEIRSRKTWRGSHGSGTVLRGSITTKQVKPFEVVLRLESIVRLLKVTAKLFRAFLVVAEAIGHAVVEAAEIPFRRNTQRRQPRIRKPFGHSILAVFDFLCSKKTMDRLIGQTIADIREEECEALNAGRTTKAWWIRNVRGHCTVLTAFAKHTLFKLLAEMVSGWKSAT